MKIYTQHNSNTKDIIPNEEIWKKYMPFFVNLGVYKLNFEYTLKFILFNSFKEAITYTSTNNSKGLDVFLKDTLDIIKKYVGKKYLNSLADFEIGTDLEQKTQSNIEIPRGQSNIEIPKTKVTHEGKQDYSMSPLDCYNYALAMGAQFYYEIRQNDGNKLTQNPKGYIIQEEGPSSGSVNSEGNCKKYAEANNLDYEGNVKLGVSSPGACILKNNKVSYNKTVDNWSNYADCSSTEKCIKIKNLEDQVGGCQVQKQKVDNNQNVIVKYIKNNFVTDVCDHNSHNPKTKYTNFCVKKWKDYIPDKTDSTNFKKDDYEEYSPYKDYMDQSEPLIDKIFKPPNERIRNLNKNAISKVWDLSLHDDDTGRYKDFTKLKNDIRDN